MNVMSMYEEILILRSENRKLKKQLSELDNEIIYWKNEAAKWYRFYDIEANSLIRYKRKAHIYKLEWKRCMRKLTRIYKYLTKHNYGEYFIRVFKRL